MKNYFSVLVLLAFNIGIIAQTYLDSDFKEIENKLEAKYYQTRETIKDRIIEKTFYMNDTLHEIKYLKLINDKIIDGKNYRYNEKGKLMYDINYSENKLNGEFLGYYENGNLRRKDFYKNDSLIEGKCFTEQGLDTAYFVYQKSASFKGGDLNKFRDYVQSSTIYPTDAAEYGIQGKVIIQFCVDSLGSVCDIKVIKSPNYKLAKAAINAILTSERWEPGYQEGKPVKQKFVIPVVFLLE